MTGVPLSYQAEPGSIRCGNSFERNLVVTGELPNRQGFGSNHKRSIPRVAKVPGGQWWSTKTPQEAAFRSSIVSRIAQVRVELQQNSSSLSPAQEASIEWLLELSEANLARVDAIYAYWDGNGEHPETGERLPVDMHPDAPPGFQVGQTSEWPLTASDAIADYIPSCAGSNWVRGQWVEDRQLVGNTVRVLREYFCPGEATRERRSEDRLIILELLLDAARAARCAQYGLWRIVLYRRALADWEEQYGDLPTFQAGGGGGYVPTPGISGAGGFAQGTRPRDPGMDPGQGTPSPWQSSGGNVGAIGPGPIVPLPQAPADWNPPDPDGLGSPSGGGGPGGGTQLEPTGGLGGSIIPSLPNKYLPLIIGGGALATYMFLKGTR
jgi:hypothetical protein